MGVKLDRFDRVVALAGNPNTGQVDAVQRADRPEAAHRQLAGQDRDARRGRLRVQQGPLQARGSAGHLLAAVGVARRRGRARLPALRHGPTCTVVVVDATALERNLNLVLQVLEITEQRRGRRQPDGRGARKGIEVDVRSLSRDLGVPAIAGRGAHRRRHARAARGGGRRRHRRRSRPSRCGSTGTPEFQRAVAELVPLIEAAAPGVPNARWIAIRLLDGDAQVEEALRDRPAGRARRRQQRPDERFSQKIALQGAQ